MRAFAIALALVLAAATAHAEPVVPRVVYAPTAWLQPRDVVHGAGALDHRGGPSLVLTGGLGDLGEVDVALGGEVAPASAGFKLGVAQGRWARAQPALAFGSRAAIAERASHLFVASSARLGPVRLHGGAGLWTAVGVQAARPFGGVEWTPAQYPRTTVLADLVWLPALDDAAARLRWSGSWGVRYQALSWGSIELLVRHREDEDLSGATVLVRVAGVLALREP